MAKLDGVNVIEATGGRVAKIEFGGETYEKVEGRAKVGDIAQSYGYFDLTKGGFYEVGESVNFEVAIYDDVNDARDAYIMDAAFRKVATFEVGDKVKVVKETHCDDIKVGEIASIVSGIDSDGEYEIHTLYDYDYAEPHTLEKVEESGSNTFEVGDRVHIDSFEGYILDERHRTGTVHYAHESGILEVSIDNYGGSLSFNPRSLTKLDGEKAETFEEGDYIVSLPSADSKYGVTTTEMKLGKVLTVSEYSIRVEILAHVDVQNVGREFVVSSKYFRKASEEEVRTELADAFKEGDIVKLTIEDGKMPTHAWGNVKNGEVGKVLFTRKDGVVKVDFPSHARWSAEPEELTKLSEEDVQQEDEKAKWAKIGREVGEYKKGDIVQVTENEALGSRNMSGDIGYVDHIDGDGDMSVQVEARDVCGANGNLHSPESIKLLIPVEQLFYRQ